MGRLDGKVAVITGAASGIGRATAIRFAGEGAAVVVADLNVDGGEATVRDCRENGGRAVFQKADVAAEDEVAAMVARAVREFGRLDITYNNAGLSGAVGPIEQVKVEDWDRSLGVLLRSVFLGIKHSAPEMRKLGGGSIISTASVAALRGSPGMHAYCAAKAAVASVTRSAAAELAKYRIRVNCICPGGINTPIIHRNRPGAAAKLEPLLAQHQPYPRAGHPDDIANMALFLAGDESEFVTGTAMVVDGGMTMVGGGARLAQIMPQRPRSGFVGPSFED